MNSVSYNSALLPGTKLLWFEIIRVLGKGGFGITYLGRDTNQDQMVAIKEYLPTAFASRRGGSEVYPNSPADKKTFDWGLDSFLKEAQIVARFRHNSIVRVVSFFRNANTAYMVMEYVEGQGLDAILKRRKVLQEASIRKILPPLLEGLELLHQSNFIHRDIKPPNILIRSDGAPVILDFGSARQSIAGQGDQMTSLLSMGYSPFEQYDSSGDRQGPWSDLYAMAGVLYRCISGDKPPDAALRIAARLRNEPDPMLPAVEVGGGRYSPEFLKAVDWALMVLENERPQSVAEWRPLLLGTQKPADVGVVADNLALSVRTPEAASVGGGVELQNGVARKKSSWRSFIASMNEFATQVNSDDLSAQKTVLLKPGKGDFNGISPTVDPAVKAAVKVPLRVESIASGETVLGGEGSNTHAHTARGVTARSRKRGAIWVDPEISLEFVWLPAGVFKMGSALGESGRRPDEMPQRDVQVDGFWMSKYLVTWGKWNQIMGDFPFGLYRESKMHHPVTRVSWNDVQKFVRLFSRKLGENINLRLPTEAEWEFAARAGDSAPYITGEEEHWSLTDYAWVKSNSGGQARKVGEKRPNDWGFYDIAGNVREWTEDRYQADYYAKGPSVNPRGGTNDEARVVRELWFSVYGQTVSHGPKDAGGTLFRP